MDEAFEVITDVAEISRLNKQLAKQLRGILRHKESREITSPAGHRTGTVYFEAPAGSGVRAWSPRIESDKLLNLVLSADPGSTKWIEITVQLNFPAGTYNRRMAGAFVKDGSGDVFVAHRGKLTKGNAGLPKNKVFREFAASTVEAADNGKTSRVILIAGLKDPELADRLWEFAEEAREVATRLGEELHGDGQSQPTRGAQSGGAVIARPGGSGGASGKDARDQKPGPPAERLLKLRGYFDEYSGEGRTKGHGGGKRTVEHGAVVRDLEHSLRSEGSSQKAQAIDLAIVAKSKVNLFEVKTSTRPTDVYTGVGQLVIHGECIKELLGLAVKRYLVLPGEPKASHCRAISGKADIKVVTYQKKGSKYRFTGLK
ncbi:hypothetical protein DVT68_00035 [Dyella solisilvae]|uniref:Uncharacterized protein n=1 Tax=Dyella solisilvae TaxID=1920168 RepID=A0A370K9G3_9GAMM|nr:hypothetical protein [Dyella solisilvae]RDI99293.1 hypothetical protein DVT68_00035 [Dyella solisilvae]